MSELDDIKVRAAERDKEPVFGSPTMEERWHEAEADVTALIAIADKFLDALSCANDDAERLMTERDEARAYAENARQTCSQAVEEMMKARAALYVIAQYDNRWKGMHVNDAPSRDDLIARAFDALEGFDE